MTLTGKSLRLSKVVARLGRSSAIVTRRHSITKRDSAIVGTLVLDGVHVEGATSLTMKCTTAGEYFTGIIPEGLLVTVGGVEYVVAADAEETRSTSRITVSITTGLAAEAADETTVTLGNAVTTSHAKVNLRPATAREVDKGTAARVDVSHVASFPGHLATRWVSQGDEVVYTYPDGRTTTGRAALLENTTWGQRVYT